MHNLLNLHPPKVADLLAHIDTLQDFAVTQLDWASGIILAVRKVHP